MRTSPAPIPPAAGTVKPPGPDSSASSPSIGSSPPLQLDTGAFASDPWFPSILIRPALSSFLCDRPGAIHHNSHDTCMTLATTISQIGPDARVTQSVPVRAPLFCMVALCPTAYRIDVCGIGNPNVAAALSTALVLLLITSLLLFLGRALSSGLQDIYQSLSGSGGSKERLSVFIIHLSNGAVAFASRYVSIPVADLLSSRNEDSFNLWQEKSPMEAEQKQESDNCRWGQSFPID